MRPRATTTTALLLATATALAADAHAEGLRAGDVPAAEPFRLVLETEAWRPRLEGNFTDDASQVDVRVPDLHDPELAFSGELRIERDRLRVAVRGFSFATDGAGVAGEDFALNGFAVDAGDAFRSGFSWWKVGLAARYDLYRPLDRNPGPFSDAQPVAPPPAGTGFSIFVTGAMEFSDMRRTLEDLADDARQDAREAFVSTYVGAGFEVSFATNGSLPGVRAVSISAQAAGGLALPADDGEIGGVARIEADIALHLCESTRAYFGYRFDGGTYAGEEMTLEGSLQGLRLGLEVRF
jgi:hypothetical protein